MSTGNPTGVTKKVTGLPSTRPVRTESKLVTSKISNKKPPVKQLSGGIKKLPPLTPSIEGGWWVGFFTTIPAVSDDELNLLKIFLSKINKKTQKELSDFLLLELKPKEKDSERELNIWISCVLTHLKAVLPATSAQIARNSPIRKLCSESYYEVSKYITAGNVPKLNIIRTSALLNLLAELLVRHCNGVSKKKNFPLSLKYILQSTYLVSGLFDNAFPGYMKNGMLDIVLDKLTKPVTKNEKEKDNE